jgi:uncharacterized protein involved in exopolysaccharide biosynthesis
MFKRFWWVFLVMVPIGALMGFGLASIVTYVMPKKFESTVTLQVRPSPSAQPLASEAFSPEAPGESRITPEFFGTQFEVIKSRNVLEKVVAKLELKNRWNVDKETAMRILKGIVDSQNIRGTDLISIRVRHTNQVDAREIAEEVANAYKANRAEIESEKADAMLQELNKAVRDQEEVVEECRKTLEDLARIQRTNLQIEGTETLMHFPTRQDYVDAQRNLATAQDLLQTMKLKQVAETISRKIPNESVMIHEEPVIADSPVSPNVTLNLVLGTALGLLLSPLMALPVMWFLNRMIPAKPSA